jgi:hypothetical protein
MAHLQVEVAMVPLQEEEVPEVMAHPLVAEAMVHLQVEVAMAHLREVAMAHLREVALLLEKIRLCQADALAIGTVHRVLP